MGQSTQEPIVTLFLPFLGEQAGFRRPVSGLATVAGSTDDGAPADTSHADAERHALESAYNHLLDDAAWDECALRLAHELHGAEAPTILQTPSVQQVSTALAAVAAALRTLRASSADDAAPAAVPTTMVAAAVTSCWMLLQAAEQAMRAQGVSPHHVAPHFPRYACLLAQVFHEGMRLGVFDETAREHALANAKHLLDNAIASAAQARAFDIRMQLTGPGDKLAYIVDRRSGRSLTEWIPLTTETSDLFIAARHLLSERVTDAYMQTLSLDQMGEVIAALAGIRSTGSLWAQMRAHQTSFALPASRVDIESRPVDVAELPWAGRVSREALQDLLLPVVVAEYFPEWRSARLDGPALVQETFQNVADKVLEHVVTSLIQGSKKEVSTMLKIVGAGTLAAAGPLVGALIGGVFGAIFPTPEPLTKAEIEALIDERVKGHLANNWYAMVKAHFDSVVGAHTMRWSILADANENVLTEDWDLGRAADWEALLDATHVLEEFMFSDATEFDFAYAIQEIVPEAMLLRLQTLYAAGQTHDAGSRTRTTLRDAATTSLKRWYAYLDKLLLECWNGAKTTDFDWFNNLTLGQRCWEVVPDKRVVSIDRAFGSNAFGVLTEVSRTLDHLRARHASYITLSSNLRKQCVAQDGAAQRHSELFQLPASEQPPRAMNIVVNYANNYWAKRMNETAARLPTRTVLKYDFDQSPRYNRSYGSDDHVVYLTSKAGKRRTYSVGDYPDLSLDGQDAIDIATVHCRMPFVIFLYSESWFGQYNDNGQVKSRGTCVVFPRSSGRVLLGNAQSVPSSYPSFKSLKVRLATPFWHQNSGRLARVLDYTYDPGSKLWVDYSLSNLGKIEALRPAFQPPDIYPPRIWP